MINIEGMAKHLESQAERGAKINYMAEVLQVKWILADMEQTQPDILALLTRSMEAHYV